ncbi:hypothetical protein CEXT_738031 [Caerostris extrusa]|uniref:Serine/threonine-protein kinase 40 n=1 Tax=Caerostris extrusa TaxID=172846 RepID=A0AAV4WHT6_CAEEX|nr:hypothetical protein CEXT_738031 [Caerostris extrusa]
MWRLERFFNEKGEEMARFFISSQKVNNCRLLRQAGDYLLGPRLGNCPVKSVVVCLAKKLDEFQEMFMTKEGWLMEGKKRKRVVLVLDCVCSFEFTKERNFINLQHYVIREKKLCEKEAVKIFYDTMCIVSDLHKQNIVHRDLKLGNIVLNKKNRSITIANFCLGKHLMNETDLLRDQRGSPAYISPDVLSGNPYLGKPSDMWAMGVVLFTMLYGQFPFYDSVPQELFRKIKAAEYNIPSDNKVSESANHIIRNLLILNPAKRMAADQVLDSLSCILASWQLTMSLENDFQIVPEQSPTKESKEDNNASKRPLPIDLDSTSAFDAVVVNWEVEKSSMKAPKVSRSLYPKSKSFTISYMYEDEKNLTVADIQKYQHLLPSSSSQ